MSDKQLFLFCDLETTGLSVSTNDILEIACTLTAEDLLPIASVHHYVKPRAGWAFGDDFVRNMHTQNGLLDTATHAGRDIADVEDDLVQFLEAWTGDATVTIAGASVHFDLAFLREHAPRAASRLHYRVFDVSTLKAAYRAWAGIDLWPKVEGSHRAVADVAEALEVARFFRRAFTAMPKTTSLAFDTLLARGLALGAKQT
jgi:oligoribonuclease